MKTMFKQSIQKVPIITTMFIFMVAQLLIAQTKSFSATANKDSVLMGNVVKVEFVIKNVEGKFEAPAFDQFEIVSGPNTSSSMYSMNGEVTSTISYTYFIKPKKEGDLFIENAYLINEKEDGKNMETDAMKIVAVPNPKGIIEEEENGWTNNFFFSFPGNDMNIDPGVKIQTEPKQEKKTNKKLKRI